MALKGLDIFKMSPKKNCKECGVPTCMAFCMKVAQGAVSIDKCPYFSDDAKAMLDEQTAPLMKTISVGEHKLGGETVLFRHEKTLVNKSLFAVSVCTCMDEATVDAKLAAAKEIDYERIGERMYVEMIHVANNQADPAVYAALVDRKDEIFCLYRYISYAVRKFFCIWRICFCGRRTCGAGVISKGAFCNLFCSVFYMLFLFWKFSRSNRYRICVYIRYKRIRQARSETSV